MGAERQGVPLAHGTGTAFELRTREELGQHLERRCRGDQRQRRIFLQQGGSTGGMVRLHVVDDQIVGPVALQGLFQVLHPDVGRAAVGGIQDGRFLIQDHKRIVGHALGDQILAFEQIQVIVVHADIADGCADGLRHNRC